MTKPIDVTTLRDWLEEHRAVTVLDIRNDDDRQQWSIPGSVHVNAYESLRNGQPGPLRNAFLPTDRPVVTVCNAGHLSESAAGYLAERGVDAYSLTGGMRAWSLAWNTAEVLLADATTRVIQVRRTGKGCLSYLIVSNGEAAVIDPSVSVDVYQGLVRQHGARITAVLETHVHADHLSRARDLAEINGATLLLPRQDRVQFPFTAVSNGDRFQIGTASLTVMQTPGHTDESIVYQLNDLALFTGDTLFTFGVGRPDLHAGADGARVRAGALYRSLCQLRAAGPQLLVLPAHTSEPVAFDGQPIQAGMTEISSWLAEWLTSEDSFIARVLDRIPETPPNFSTIVGINERGEQPDRDPSELEAGANRCAVSR